MVTYVYYANNTPQCNKGARELLNDKKHALMKNKIIKKKQKKHNFHRKYWNLKPVTI